MSTDEMSSLIWRKQRRTHSSRFEHILESGLFSDITFRVGYQGQVIRGHKIILITGSPVFQAMLTGKSYDEDNNGFIIQDIEPPEFRILLKYLYTGQEPKTLNILPLFRAAKYFMVEELIEICVSKISKKLSLENVLQTYEMSLKYNEDELEKMCLEFICKNGNLILERAEFCNLSIEILTKIISADQFRANDEVQIALEVYKWGKKECIHLGLKESPENIRHVLLPLISLIRFPQIDPEEFSIKIVPLGILTSEELVSILLYFNLPTTSRASIPPGKFNPNPRNYMTSSTSNKFYTLKRKEAIYKDAVISSGVSWSDISFQVDKAINVTSLGLFLYDLRDLLSSNCSCLDWSCSISCCEQEVYSKDLKLKLEIRIISPEGNIKSTQLSNLKGSKYVQHIQFDPVSIKPFLTYKIQMKYQFMENNTETSIGEVYKFSRIENFLALHYKGNDCIVPISGGNSVNFKFVGYQMTSPNPMNLINEINFTLAKPDLII